MVETMFLKKSNNTEFKLLQKRFIYFLGLCIPARISLALLAKYIPLKLLQIMGYFTLIAGIWFLYAFIIKPYDYAKVIKTTKVWWQDIRILHACTYITFSYLAINKQRNAWIALMIDAFIGLYAFLFHHYTIDSYAKFFGKA